MEKTNDTLTLVLPFPISTNATWRNYGKRRTVLSKGAKTFRLAVMSVVVSRRPSIRAELPLSGDLSLDVVLHPPDRRKRDLDNFTGKSLLDAMTHARVWRDDSQVKKITTQWGNIIPGGRCIVMIEQSI